MTMRESHVGAGALRAVVGLYDALVASSARRVEPGVGARRYGRPSDFAALKRLVHARGLLARQPVYYALKVTSVLALWAFAGASVWLARNSPLLWLGAPLTAFAAGQLVLLGHDAAHQAVFAGRRANDALALVAINLLNGGSHGWWAQSHNEHHARSNLRDLDPDIDYPFLAFSEAQALAKDPRFRPILVRQHWLAPLFMSLVGLNLRLYSLAWLSRRRHRSGEIGATAAYYLLYPTALVAALGPGRAALFLLAQQVLFGLYIGAATAPNHWGMPMPEDAASLDFVRHQVETSRNIHGGALVHLFYGGLDLQAEHHLFPTMPRNHLARVRPLVRAFCEERGIAYHEASPLGAYAEMFTTLRRVARFVRAQDEAEPLRPADEAPEPAGPTAL
jgi:fatty acid desaturase